MPTKKIHTYISIFFVLRKSFLEKLIFFNVVYTKKEIRCKKDFSRYNFYHIIN
jgi:hypothetical protein